MSERHRLSIVSLFKGIEVGEPSSKFGKVVEITHGDVKFVGFLVEKSIVIPTNAGEASDEALSLFVAANLEAIRGRSCELPLPATCHLLGLPYFGQTSGLYSDGQQFHQISGVHLHPKAHLETQEEFIHLARNVLRSVGSKLTIIEGYPDF